MGAHVVSPSIFGVLCSRSLLVFRLACVFSRLQSDLSLFVAAGRSRVESVSLGQCMQRVLVVGDFPRVFLFVGCVRCVTVLQTCEVSASAEDGMLLRLCRRRAFSSRRSEIFRIAIVFEDGFDEWQR